MGLNNRLLYSCSKQHIKIGTIHTRNSKRDINKTDIKNCWRTMYETERPF